MAMHFHEAFGDEDPERARKAARDMMGPQAVDRAIAQAIMMCWMLLPEEKKSVAVVEAEIRRIMERALANLRDDASAFGIRVDD